MVGSKPRQPAPPKNIEEAGNPAPNVPRIIERDGKQYAVFGEKAKRVPSVQECKEKLEALIERTIESDDLGSGDPFCNPLAEGNFCPGCHFCEAYQKYWLDQDKWVKGQNTTLDRIWAAACFTALEQAWHQIFN